MRARSRFPRSFAAASLLLLTGCVGDLLVGGCNLVGCVNGLSIALSRVPTGAYTVQLLVEGEAPREIRCPDPNRCSGPAFFFQNALPTVATVVVTTAAGEARQEVRPTYTTSRPNGRGCDPVCRNGTATFTANIPGA
jgi:hypothetical protein